VYRRTVSFVDDLVALALTRLHFILPTFPGSFLPRTPRVTMSNNDKTNGYNTLKVSKFDHSSTTPRAMRWREWVVKLRYSFGAAHPLLANQTSEVLDPLAYWWGVTWSPLLDFDNMTQEQEHKLYVDFQKAQYSLLHVLSENFGTHEKQIIADHDPVQLVGKLKDKYSDTWKTKLELFPDKPGWTRRNG
jgi:hypothetical protein